VDYIHGLGALFNHYHSTVLTFCHPPFSCSLITCIQSVTRVFSAADRGSLSLTRVNSTAGSIYLPLSSRHPHSFTQGRHQSDPRRLGREYGDPTTSLVLLESRRCWFCNLRYFVFISSLTA